MSNLSPILYLVVGLLCIGLAIAWGLSIYVAVKVCQRSGRRAWPWVLLTVASGFLTLGHVALGAGYLAKAWRRAPHLWGPLQFLVGVAAVILLDQVLRRLGNQSVALDFVLLTGAVLLAFSPAILLALLGPRGGAQVLGGSGLVEARDLHRTYRLGRRDLHVLRGVSLTVQPGEFVVILGASGSGKSTLLHLLGLLDLPSSGQVCIGGCDVAGLSGPQRDRLRRNYMGFVFQFYHLLPELTVLQNVLLPVQTELGVGAWLAQRGRWHERAVELLKQVGLGERLNHRPRELSGGEQQRVAIARALINQPRLLLADEPTGNLDSKTGAQIVRLLRDLNKQTGQTVVMVTHDQALAELADRVLHLRDGKLQ